MSDATDRAATFLFWSMMVATWVLGVFIGWLL